MSYELFHFNFPPITIPDDEFHLLEQCYKVEEEAHEITDAFADDTIPLGMKHLAIIEETLDCIQACETLLNYYVLNDIQSLNTVDYMYQAVIEKNSMRGYYDDCE